MNTEIHTVLVLSLLVAAFIMILVLHIIENKRLTAILQKKYTAELAKQIKRFAWSRTIQLLSVMSFSFLLIILYDWKINNTQELLTALQNIKAADIVPDSNQQILQNPENTENYFPKVIANDNADKKSISGIPDKNTIQDIFTSEGNINDYNLEMDNIKIRYEEIFITYFFLQKCEKATNSDYQLILAALQNEIAASPSPERLQNDILIAAKGSYEELYSHNDCLQADVEAMAGQYNIYLNSLSEKLTNIN